MKDITHKRIIYAIFIAYAAILSVMAGWLK
jgi:hypothetical protein